MENNIVQDIIRFVEKNSFQQLDGDLEEMDETICFTTREHGDVGAEEYSPIDFDDAQNIVVKVMANFGHAIKQYDIDTCDEWVNVEITLR